MRKKIIWLIASSLMVLAMLAAACAPAAEEAAPSAPTPAAKTPAAPAAKEESKPAAKETAAPTTGKDIVKVSWENGDGVMVEADYERPRYGGVAKWCRSTGVLAWDEALQAPWSTAYELSHINEELIQGEWPRGPVVTGEVAWIVGGWMREDFSYGALAESWEFPDDTTAIFHIRKGIHWQNKPPVNGREYNAHDAVFNIKRIYFDIQTSTMYGMAGVSRPVDVYAEDDWTVVLKTPEGQLGKCWEFIADWTRHFPPEVIEKYGDHNDWVNVVGTGPFVLTDYVPMASVTFTRNPNYWMEDPLIPGNQLPYVDGLKEFIIPDKSTELAALRTAKIDWPYSSQTEEDALPIMRSNPEIRVREYSAVGFSNLGFRQDKPDLPFDDVNVRRALLMGVNQQEIIDTYYNGKGAIVPQIVMDLEMFKDVWTPIDELPPAPDGFDNRKMFEYHPDEAKQLLADAGYPDGFKFTVTMRRTPNYVDHMSMAKEYWAKIGVEMEMDIKETGTFYSMYQRKTHPDALLCGRWAGEPYSAFCVRKGNMYNWAMVDVPAFDDYYDQMTALYFKPKERDVVMKKFNLAIIDNATYYMLPVGIYYYFWQPWIKNYEAARALGIASYYYQKYIWIDQDLKESMGY